MSRIFECSENGGFHVEVPGHSGAIRALLSDNGEVLEVVPYGQLLSIEKQPVQEQQPVAQHVQEQTVQEQPSEPPAQEESQNQESQQPEHVNQDG